MRNVAPCDIREVRGIIQPDEKANGQGIVLLRRIDAARGNRGEEPSDRAAKPSWSADRPSLKSEAPTMLSRQLVLLVIALQKSTEWATARDLAARSEQTYSCARHHLVWLAREGHVECSPVFGGYRYRWNRQPDYLRGSDFAREVAEAKRALGIE